METAQSFLGLHDPTVPRNTLHILSGSFRSLSLFLLAFEPANRSLSLVQTVDAFGPHQYLALNPTKDRAFATTWTLPPSLSSWEIDRNEWRVNHINNVPITATSSYIIVPPPYTHIYSAGGPTGEVHSIDPSTGGFGEKNQQFLFVPEDELEKADKTRVALRYGSHGIEFSTPLSLAFIPVLGTDSIEVYKHDKQSGLLTPVYSSPSPRGKDAHDGPRHVKVHPNGKVLYCVTEHSNHLDTYLISPTSPYLTHLSTRSLLPPPLSLSSSSSSTSTSTTHSSSSSKFKYRGDTLLLSPSTPSHPVPHTIWTTTRGGKEDVRGWVSVFELGEDGDFVIKNNSSSGSSLETRSGSHGEEERVEKNLKDEEEEEEEYGVERYETPTSGGKAHAIDLYPKELVGMTRTGDEGEGERERERDSEGEGEGAVWILLTDDSDYASVGPGTEVESSEGNKGGRGRGRGRGRGGVRVLEWDGWGKGGVREVVGWPKAKAKAKGDGDSDSGSGNQEEEEDEEGKERMMGGSHAVWLD
ncbi:putative isomerase YbhE [Dendrothele bispora CBS 962.96]|uniref:Putative isomerase YbhE n=1 Tax=Dendrothele bispora (strain CBS 962.96) TaxID=1314807 RepID=A0A4S8L413_DENBC|nr:putative isomerase YbhE [Dendrothele bispora CBS 962.96]